MLGIRKMHTHPLIILKMRAKSMVQPRRKNAFLIIIALSILGGVFLQSQNAFAQVEDEGLKKRVIIIYDGFSAKASHADSLESLGVTIRHSYSIIPGVAALVNENLIEQIKSNPNVQGVYEDIPVRAFMDDSVPQIRADLVNSAGITGSGVRVCIVDTGVDDSHPYLPTLVAEYDFVNNDNNAFDDHGHGTHVSGTVVSSHPSYKGVAYGASLMAAKVLNANGGGFSSDVIAGINWCVLNGADVISMSLGGGLYSGTCDFVPMAFASNQAVVQGVAVFAASGNDFRTTQLAAPACGSKVISVGAVNIFDNIASFSNGGVELDIVAPGVSITSTYPPSRFASLSGTSMATPHAAAVAALLLESDSTLTPAQVRTILRDTAVDLGPVGFDNRYGHGRIDAYSAYLSTLGNNSPPVAQPDSYSTTEDTTLTVNSASGVLANDSDADGDALSAVLVSGTTNGVLTLNADGSLTYQPNSGFVGIELFTYKANDGTDDSNVVTVSIDVDAQSESGILFFDDFQSGFGKWTESGDLDWNIEFPAEKAVPGSSLSNLVAHADLCGNPGCTLTMSNPIDLTGYSSATLQFWRYVDTSIDRQEYLRVEAYDGTSWNTIFYWTQKNGDDDTWHHETFDLIDYLGTDNFKVQFVAKASQAIEELEIDDVTIEGVALQNNNPPVAYAGPDNTVTDSDNDGIETVTLDGSASFDTDGTIISYEWNEGLTVLGSSAVMDIDFTVGIHDVTLTVTDDLGASDVDDITITINTPANTAPVAQPDSYSTTEDTTLTVNSASGVLANDSDADGDALSAVLVSGTSNGVLTLNADGSLTYQPNSGFVGMDFFTYKANDGTDDSNVVTVSIDVDAAVPPANTAPVAQPDSYSTTEDITLTVNSASGVLANDSDADGDALSAVLVSGTSNGVLTLNADGSLTYQPNSGFVGMDFFTYKANDGTDDSNVATVMILVLINY